MAERDGPPVPPPVRRRRRRRLLLGVAAAVLLLIGLPVALTVAGVVDPGGEELAPSDGERDPGRSGATEPGTDGPEDAEEPPSGDADPEPPELDGLEGTDAAFGRLLTDVDASERTMIAFQDDLAQLFAEHAGADGPEEVADAVSAIADDRLEQLLSVRQRLDEPVEDAAAEDVRERYVAHLDSWANYMAAVAEEPAVLMAEDTGARYTLDINTTAARFAAELERGLPEDLDEDVEAFAEGILDRGFRTDAEADV